MSAVLHAHPETGPAPAAPSPPDKRVLAETGMRGRWWRFVLILVITAIVLVPDHGRRAPGLHPARSTAPPRGFTFENFGNVFAKTDVAAPGCRTACVTTISTVVVSVVVAAPAGYVLSRGRSQSRLRVLAAAVRHAVPARHHLGDPAVHPVRQHRTGGQPASGLIIIYVGSTMSVATWMMAAYFDSIPISLEEAAWIDGCSVFGCFTRVVLRNSPARHPVHRDLRLPARLERLPRRHRVPALQRNLHPAHGRAVLLPAEHHRLGPVMAVAVVMMLPPVIVFATLNRYFSVGGIGGSLAGR